MEIYKHNQGLKASVEGLDEEMNKSKNDQTPIEKEQEMKSIKETGINEPVSEKKNTLTGPRKPSKKRKIEQTYSSTPEENTPLNPPVRDLNKKQFVNVERASTNPLKKKGEQVEKYISQTPSFIKNKLQAEQPQNTNIKGGNSQQDDPKQSNFKWKFI